MSLDTLQEFFLWCMLINFGLYLITVIALFAFRPIVVTIHRKLFGFDEAAVNRSMHAYLGAFKLLTTVFSFTPWLAITIIK